MRAGEYTENQSAMLHTHISNIILYTNVCVCVCVCAQLPSCVWLFGIPWTVACQAPLSMGFSRQEYWSGFPFPPPGDLPHPGIEPRSPTLQVDSLPAEPQGKPKNTRVGSLSLLQGIFLTQESNWIPCIAGGFLTNWAIRETLFSVSGH